VELEKPIPTNEATWLTRLLGRMSGTAERRRAMVTRRIAAATALSRIESGNFGTSSAYWSLPHGEPQWITIPAGEFRMGSDEHETEQPVHRLFVPEFRVARTPVTNAQYQLYVQATKGESPPYWEDGQPQRIN
jgi:formylglycine-generating enzyme required for sulfatase activity